jgi:hypothetical protein
MGNNRAFNYCIEPTQKNKVPTTHKSVFFTGRLLGFCCFRVDGAKFKAVSKDEMATEADQFLCQLYEYYDFRGSVNMRLARWVDLIVVFVTGLMVFNFTFCIRWHQLVHCDTMDACTSSFGFQSPLPWNALQGFALAFLCVIALRLIWALMALCAVYSTTRRLSAHYQIQLQIQDDALHVTSWNTVLQKIVQVSDEKSIDATHLRLMRLENYALWFYNLNHKEKWCWFGSVLDFCLTQCIWGNMFVFASGALDLTAKKLATRLRCFSAISFLLMPFIFIWTLLHTFFKEGERQMSNKNQVNDLFSNNAKEREMRTWNKVAIYKYRKYNEPLHMVYHRLNCAVELCTQYNLCFPSYSRGLMALAHVVYFSCGAILASMIIFTVLNPNSMTLVEIFGRNLVSYAFIVGMVLAISKGYVSSVQPTAMMNPTNVEVEHRALTRKIYETLQVDPLEFPMATILNDLLYHKVKVLRDELVSVLCTPFVLWFLSTTQSTEDILQKIKANTRPYANVGSVCTHSIQALQPFEEVRGMSTLNIAAPSMGLSAVQPSHTTSSSSMAQSIEINLGEETKRLLDPSRSTMSLENL